MVSSYCSKNIEAQNCPGLTKAAMSDKDSNKYEAKTTVLFNKLSHQLKFKTKTKQNKKKKGTHTHFGLIVKLGAMDFTL